MRPLGESGVLATRRAWSVSDGSVAPSGATPRRDVDVRREGVRRATSPKSLAAPARAPANSRRQRSVIESPGSENVPWGAVKLRLSHQWVKLLGAASATWSGLPVCCAFERLLRREICECDTELSASDTAALRARPCDSGVLRRLPDGLTVGRSGGASHAYVCERPPDATEYDCDGRPRIESRNVALGIGTRRERRLQNQCASVSVYVLGRVMRADVVVPALANQCAAGNSRGSVHVSRLERIYSTSPNLRTNLRWLSGETCNA